MKTDLSLATLRAAYTAGEITPHQLFQQIDIRADSFADHNIWIFRLGVEEREPYLRRLAQLDPQKYPLWGVPFAIKDNIDLAGVPTTAACEAFAYTPDRSAVVVEKLIDAGAIPVGKTNLDQFATGLVGTRSPWGACKNAFDPTRISGGSSAGSAVAVALGLASFSLGTDTAGSGRVPAAFNGLIGVKPTRGLLSGTGMVPACRSLDTISLFAANVADAGAVLAVAEGKDPKDPWSVAPAWFNAPYYRGSWRGAITLGVIPEEQLQFFGDADFEQAWRATLLRLSAMNVNFREIDFAPFVTAAKELYEGPWVAERYLATRKILDEQPEAMLPVTRQIIKSAQHFSAASVFESQYHLADLRSACLKQFDGVDALLTPTVGRHYTIAEVEADPIATNSTLGYYTNFMNLLDMAGLSLPGVAAGALPFGITLVGDRQSDRRLLALGAALEALLDVNEGVATELPPYSVTKRIPIAVCGAHLDGLPLNAQLTMRGATLLAATRSAPGYRLFALPGGPPFRPAMVRDSDSKSQVDVEVWSLSADQWGSFVSHIPAPLGIGKVELESGELVSGFICEANCLEGAEDITRFGGWRAYMAQR